MTRQWTSLLLILALMIGVSTRPATAVEYARKIPQDPTGGGYQAFPDITRLNDGRLMCVFYNGYSHISLPNSSSARGGRIDYSISSDEGYTWSSPSVLYDSPDDDRDPSITQLKNGQLMLNFFSMWAPSTPGGEYGCAGPQVITSANIGASWSAAQTPFSSYPNQASYANSSPIRELSNGRLVLPIYYQTGSNAANGTAFGAVAVSDDHGTTWSDPKTIPLPAAGEQQFLCAETDVIQLKDSGGNFTSHLYAAQRTNFDSMYFSTSTDFGDTWNQSQAIGFNAHCPYLHRTANDIVLLAYRDYNSATTALRYSLDECQTWSDRVVVDTVGGAYPSIVDLKDGSGLIAYYEEGAGSNIRVKRFRATAAGIEWLPVESMHTPEPGMTTLLLTGVVGLVGYVWSRRGRRNRLQCV